MTIKNLAFLATTALFVTGLTACSADGNFDSGWDPDDEPTSNSTCFDELTPENMDKIKAQQSAEGNKVEQMSDDTICVIDSKGNQRFVHKNEDNKFWMYYMLSHSLGGSSMSNPLLTYGMISGDVSPMQYMALSMMSGVDDRGRAYHPYSYESGRFVRQADYSRNITVNNVYYGDPSKTTPKKFSTDMVATAPKGYTTGTLSKPTSADAATVAKDGKISKDPSVNAKSFVNSNKITPPAKPGKTYTPVTRGGFGSKSTGSGSSSSGSSGKSGGTKYSGGGGGGSKSSSGSSSSGKK